MKRFAAMLLLIGAVLGLFAQAPARALAPAAEAKVAAAMASMPDCMEKMDEVASQKPCDCTRADCIAAMLGGASLFTAAEPASEVVTPTDRIVEPTAGRAVQLVGRNIGPEPDPPQF